MVIGFKKQFVEPILQGSKVHTIRDDNGKRWKPGMSMQMYTGSRFSKTDYKKFSEKECISTQGITMFLEEDDNGLDILRCFIDELKQGFDFEAFAKADGFHSAIDFANWWTKVLEDKPGRKFEGIIIHWTDLRY